MAMGGLSVWNPRTKSEIALLSTNGSNLRVAFSPSGPLLAFSDYDHVRLWDGATRQTPGRDLPLGGQCLGLAFSADGRSLALGATNGEIRIWDLESHLDLLTLEGRGSRFTWTAFSPDGNVLGSVNGKHVLHL